MHSREYDDRGYRSAGPGPVDGSGPVSAPGADIAHESIKPPPPADAPRWMWGVLASFLRECTCLTRSIPGCWRWCCRRSAGARALARRRRGGLSTCCCWAWRWPACRSAIWLTGLGDRGSLAIGLRRLEPRHGRHGPGSVVRPDPGRACARGRRQGDLRGRRADDPHGPVSARFARRVLAVFFLAVPLGAALGLSVARRFARVTTWQTAFLAVGAPGLLLALLALVVPDPVRGRSEGIDIQRLRLHEHVGPSREDYIDLMVNSSYTYSVFGMTFSSFALAGWCTGRPRS